MVYESICEELLLFFELFSFSMHVLGRVQFLTGSVAANCSEKGRERVGKI
jgi:hypothetical protein